MPDFQELFVQSKGQPITYKGNVIQMVDCLEVAPGQQLRLTFECVDSEWRQGACLTTDGSFAVNNREMKDTVVLWHDTAPGEVLLKVQTRKGQCWLKNVWETEDGLMHSWHNGAAMIVEKTENGRRYRCNDGRADDDFDDLIFRIEFVHAGGE